jgi:ribosomal protein S18 acetylase RimI-like enzyme
MRKAGSADKIIVLEILIKSFRNDPLINFLLEKSKNRQRLNVFMEFLYEESFNKGEIYINDENTAVALWSTSKSENVSIRFILRNLTFLVNFGWKGTLRVLHLSRKIYQFQPENGNFAHLYTIGVLPEGKGRGYVRQMINFMNEKLKNSSAVLYLETSCPKLIGQYNKLGFHVFNTIQVDGQTLFCMNNSMSI